MSSVWVISKTCASLNFYYFVLIKKKIPECKNVKISSVPKNWDRPTSPDYIGAKIFFFNISKNLLFKQTVRVMKNFVFNFIRLSFNNINNKLTKKIKSLCILLVWLTPPSLTNLVGTASKALNYTTISLQTIILKYWRYLKF